MADQSTRSDLVPADECWRVQLVGRFSIVGPDSADATPRGRKDRAILAYLLLHKGDRVPRERLMEMLWGDRGERQARASLRQALTQIRGATRNGRDFLRADRDHVWVDTACVVEVVEDPDCPRQDGAQLFDDLDHITPAFDDWLALERARWARETGGALRNAVEKSIERGESAIPLIERMQRLDPFDEEGLRLAMVAEYRAGNTAGIQQRFRVMEQRLHRELGVLPSKDTRALHDQLLAELAGNEAGTSGDTHAGSPQLWPVRDPRPSTMPVQNLIARVLGVAVLLAGL
jgi:DNA-binding SARP family transcriptional activator